jgi:hypothetical protein
MKFAYLVEHVKNNLIAVVSLAIALTALGYTAWREEATEKNRTVREAGFEVLKNLGELQLVINYALYDPQSPLGNPYLGWGYVAIVSDMSSLLPEEVQIRSQRLTEVWGENWKELKTSEAAADAITKEVDAARETTVQAMRHLR